MTLKELMEEIREKNKNGDNYGFFAPSQPSDTFPNVSIISDLYHSNHTYREDIDQSFFTLYNGRDTLIENYDEWILNVRAILRKNEYKYNELFETMNVVYNKMENYDMTETGTDTVKKTGTVSSSGTDTQGTHTDTKNDTIGGVSNSSSDVYGNGKTTETHKKNPFNDSDTSYVDSVNITETDSKTDTRSETYGSQSNTSTTSYGEQIDTKSNTDTYNTTDTTTHTFSRHGNIGVLSGQQLVEQSRNVAMFSIWTELFKDVSNVLLTSWL